MLFRENQKPVNVFHTGGAEGRQESSEAAKAKAPDQAKPENLDKVYGKAEQKLQDLERNAGIPKFEDLATTLKKKIDSCKKAERAGILSREQLAKGLQAQLAEINADDPFRDNSPKKSDIPYDVDGDIAKAVAELKRPARKTSEDPVKAEPSPVEASNVRTLRAFVVDASAVDRPFSDKPVPPNDLPQSVLAIGRNIQVPGMSKFIQDQDGVFYKATKSASSGRIEYRREVSA